MLAYPQITKSLDAEIFQGRQRSTLIPLRSLMSGMFLKARIDFAGSNEERAKNQSDFDALFLGRLDPVRIDIMDGFWYAAVLVSISEPSTSYEMITTVEYCWRVTRHKDAVARTFQVSSGSPASIWCDSNVQKTDCNISISQVAVTQNATSMKVAVNDLTWVLSLPETSQSYPTLILDGIKKKCEWHNTDWPTFEDAYFDFPFLVPGTNEIQVYLKIGTNWTACSAQVEVGFTPTYA